MEAFLIQLLAPLQGMDGLALLALILLMFALFYCVRPSASRRDSKRRNQAHRVR